MCHQSLFSTLGLVRVGYPRLLCTSNVHLVILKVNMLGIIYCLAGLPLKSDERMATLVVIIISAIKIKPSQDDNFCSLCSGVSNTTTKCSSV